MASNLEQQASPISNMVSLGNNDITDELFYAIIDRLKVQKALPRDSFTKEMPFFNFSSVSKESQVKELFQDISDPSMYRSLIKNIISLPDEKNPDLITKRLSAMQVMGFAQIILYKVLPCVDNCPNRPREIATHNQYKDYEYECPFYHHDKDRRRMVLSSNIDEEFVYKANYFEDGKRQVTFDKDKYSQNYFESMFHPLYYKMFRCKRDYCNFSQFCPFYHSEEEKKTWDRVFSNFIRKDRISYVKDKQKYYENNSHHNHAKNSENNNNGRILRAGCGDPHADKENQSINSNISTNPNSPKSNYKNNGNNNSSNGKQNYKNRTPKYQQQGQQQTSPNQPLSEWRSQKYSNSKSGSGKRWDNQKKSPNSGTKDFGDNLNNNSSPVGSFDSFDPFQDQKEIFSNRVC